MRFDKQIIVIVIWDTAVMEVIAAADTEKIAAL